MTPAVSSFQRPASNFQPPAAGLPRESIPCDICQVDDAVFVCEAPSRYSDERFRLVRCRRCSLIYVNPRQSEPAKLAQRAVHSGSAEVEAHQSRDEVVYQLALETIERVCLHRGLLLDVGAATGGLLRTARDHGWDVCGVEPAKPLAEFAARTYGLAIVPGTLEDAHFADGSFDAVIMVHTIEHLYHPSRTVAEVFRVLKPGGYFYSMTPDWHHYAVRVAQRFGFLQDTDAIDPTAHPYYFTPRTHTMLVERQGFRVISCGSPISGLFALRNGHAPNWSSQLWQATARPVAWLSQAVPIGSTVQCLAQRPSGVGASRIETGR